MLFTHGLSVSFSSRMITAVLALALARVARCGARRTRLRQSVLPGLRLGGGGGFRRGGPGGRGCREGRRCKLPVAHSLHRVGKAICVLQDRFDNDFDEYNLLAAV